MSRVDVTLSGATNARATPSSVAARAAAPAPTVSTPGAGTFPFLISTDFGAGRTSEASQVADWVNNYGGSGWTHYITTANPLAWDGTLQAVASAFPNFPMYLQLTSRNYSNAGMDSVLASLPDAWRPGFTYNYFQEPEDNLAGNTAGQTAYKNTVTSAANRIRAWNTANPTRTVALPWLEFAEYSLYRQFVLGNPDRDPSNLLPPAADYAGIHWSIFEYGEASDMPTFSFLNTQITRVTNFMNNHAPGKSWGTMGWNYTLEPLTSNTDASYGSYTTLQRQRQASWLTQSYNRFRANGCEQVSWYNVKFYAPGESSNGEARIQPSPETLAAYLALDRSV